jgi:phage FluMu protein Com
MLLSEAGDSMTKECPMCNEIMRIHATTETTRIPGTTQHIVREGKEWRCPECDYFEELDDETLRELAK